jgi:hypothetical protein
VLQKALITFLIVNTRFFESCAYLRFGIKKYFPLRFFCELFSSDFPLWAVSLCILMCTEKKRLNNSLSTEIAHRSQPTCQSTSAFAWHTRTKITTGIIIPESCFESFLSSNFVRKASEKTKKKPVL